MYTPSLYTGYTPPRTCSSAVQLVHDGWKIIEYTVVRCIPCTRYSVHATSYILYCTIGCTQRLAGNRVYCCAPCTRRRVYQMYLAVTLSVQLHSSILSCSSKTILCFTVNRERRRAAGQLVEQENARYKDSYLRPFNPARPLHFESWVQRDMQKGFTDEPQRLRPGRCQFCGERWFAPQTPTQTWAVAGGQYTCDRCKRDKKTVKSFSSVNDMDPGSVPNQLTYLTQVDGMFIAKGFPNSALNLPLSFGYEKKCASELSLGRTTPPRGCSVISVQIYVSLVRRRVETPTTHYTNTCIS